MGVATKLAKYLKTKHISFTLLKHDYSEGTFNTARAANIDEASLAKGVLLRDEDFHYILCILPAGNKILRGTLNTLLDRRLEMVPEDELIDIFKDCAQGAIPALGEAYGVDVIWDDALALTNEIYLEAGDHHHLIRLGQPEFTQLMAGKLHDHFSIPRPQHSKNLRQQLRHRH